MRGKPRARDASGRGPSAKGRSAPASVRTAINLADPHIPFGLRHVALRAAGAGDVCGAELRAGGWLGRGLAGDVWGDAWAARVVAQRPEPTGVARTGARPMAVDKRMVAGAAPSIHTFSPFLQLLGSVIPH